MRYKVDMWCPTCGSITGCEHEVKLERHRPVGSLLDQLDTKECPICDQVDCPHMAEAMRWAEALELVDTLHTQSVRAETGLKDTDIGMVHLRRYALVKLIYDNDFMGGWLDPDDLADAKASHLK